MQLRFADAMICGLQISLCLVTLAVTKTAAADGIGNGTDTITGIGNDTDTITNSSSYTLPDVITR